MSAPAPPRVSRLLLRQRHVLHGWTWDLLDPAGRPLGELRVPDVAQASNARLRWHPPGSGAGDVQLAIAGQAWRIQHTYLERSAHPDMRHALLAPDGTPVAAVERRAVAGRRRPEWRITGPIAGLLRREPGWLRQRYVLEIGGRPAGRIEEPALMALRKAFAVSLASPLPLPEAAFYAWMARIAG
jgi:hypothetical protein